ncbi:MAG TPA: sodium:calcium antiporter [Pseudoduganella sp.]
MSAAPVWPHVASLLVAAALAAMGGEWFVRGVVGTAARWRLSELLVAMTVAACATSAPELMVSVIASSDGNSALAMGDALGSNVTNILLILGLSLLFGSLAVSAGALRWHLAGAFAAPLLTGALLADGFLSRWDGAILLLLFCAWLAATVLAIRRTKVPVNGASRPPCDLGPVAIAASLVGGMVFLALAGRLFANGGRALASVLGLPDAVVGATMVALGTSMPELVTTLVSRWRGHHDVGVGTLLGSNLFNGLAILGTAALITPVRAAWRPASVVLLFGVLAILLVIPRRQSLPPQRGMVMLGCYVLYVMALGLTGGLE